MTNEELKNLYLGKGDPDDGTDLYCNPFFTPEFWKSFFKVVGNWGMWIVGVIKGMGAILCGGIIAKIFGNNRTDRQNNLPEDSKAEDRLKGNILERFV